MLRRNILVVVCLLVACGDNKTPQPIHQPYDAGSLPQLSCVPNLDGQIDATELQPALDNPVHYLVSPPGVTRQVDLAGTVDAQGHRVWDFGSDYADDQVATITATSITGKWYASSFPSATFVAPFDAGDTLEAVYAYNTTAIVLLGLASRDPGGPGGKTLVAYAPPIALYQFPLHVGQSYQASGTITNGTLRGLPYAGTDTYDIAVDASGQLTLEAYTFSQVLRVRTTATVAPSAGQSITTRQTSFFFECFGEVARATSQPGETNDDFTTAAELRRLQEGESAMFWDTYKKGFDAWENATAKLLKTWLKSPLVLKPSGAMLTSMMRMKAASDRMNAMWWGAMGLPTKRDQERTLHLLNKLESRMNDLEEKLDER